MPPALFMTTPVIYTVGHKNVPLHFCPYHRQLLTNLQNSFTDTSYR